jgi:hypothetical protein
MKKIKTERLQRFAEYLTTQDFVSADYFSPLPQLVYVDDHGSPIPVNPVLFLALFEMPHIIPENWAYNNRRLFSQELRKTCLESYDVSHSKRESAGR